MKRIAAKILCIVLAMAGLFLQSHAQDRSLRIGFQSGPVFSWVNNNDKFILKNSSNFGLKLGTTADLYFKENYSFTMGLNLAFHEGGEFLYERGGNYLPESELSDPLLQMGDRPLEDGTRIRYNLHYLEVPIGMKIRSKEFGYIRYFVEAPVFTFSFLTRGRGNITTEDTFYEQENIYKDLSIFNIFWGLGAGIEYSISQTNSLIGGVYYQNGLLDFTKDKGHMAVPNPDFNPPYLLQEEDSRATVSNIVIKVGIIF